MTFNLRYSAGNDGINCWENRRNAVSEIIKKYQPDIVGFQEAMRDQVSDLKQRLPEYLILEDGENYLPHQKERTPIFYLPTKVKLEPDFNGVFWMSKTPDRPTYRWWGVNPRLCVWGHFIEIQSNKKLAVYHIHYDHIWEFNRKRMAKLTLDRMQKQSNNLPQILLGDFNMNPFSQAYRIIHTSLRDLFLEKPNLREDNHVTFHNFTGAIYTQKDKRGIIQWVDYIWGSTGIKKINSAIIRDPPKENTTPAQYVTDHWVLQVDIDL